MIKSVNSSYIHYEKEGKYYRKKATRKEIENILIKSNIEFNSIQYMLNKSNSFYNMKKSVLDKMPYYSSEDINEALYENRFANIDMEIANEKYTRYASELTGISQLMAHFTDGYCHLQKIIYECQNALKDINLK